MEKTRIERAIDIINYAIDNNISVSVASVKNGFANTYVKNAKRIVKDKYENGSITKQEHDRFFNVYNKYKGNKSTDNNNDMKVNNKKVVNGENISYQESGDEATVEYKGDSKSFGKAISGDGNSTDDTDEDTGHGSNYRSDHITSLDQLLKRCNVDLDLWGVKDYIVNKWDVTSWKRGYPETIENFQVKAKLEKIKEEFDARNMAEIFRELVEDYKPPKLDKYNTNWRSNNDLDIRSIVDEENNLLEINIFDLHLGKLGWKGETGENFDVKIASDRFLKAIELLLIRAQGFNISKILFPIGNDFFNSDNLHNTTTNGTPQDEDLRWQKTFKLGTQLIVDGINLLKQTGVDVDVIMIPGNHDFQRNFYLGTFLEGFFDKDEQVKINNEATPRKYYHFGEVLLGFTHGKYEKEASLPLLMAGEEKKLWGNTTFHEWHLGHIHRKRQIKYSVLDKNKILDEELGVTIRYMSSLTGAEEWHHKKGFVNQIKAADGFIWNDKTGLIGHLNANFVN